VSAVVGAVLTATEVEEGVRADTCYTFFAVNRANLQFAGINSEEIFQADFMRPESCSSFKTAPTPQIKKPREAGLFYL
jgi:hypothetical protein